MNPILLNMILRRGRNPYAGYDDSGLPLGRIAIGTLLVLAALIGWLVYEDSQWETLSVSNVPLRVARTDGDRRFTPILVDDSTGQVFEVRIGGKRCRGGPAAMPVGATILTGVEKRRDRRDGRIRHDVDVGDLARRYC